MKKLALIPLALIVLMGALWASSTLLPDTDEFPSNPQTPGTLGYILSFFGTDGTAKNSLALGGVSATGYLQVSNTTCTNPGEVWKGINTDGRVECDTLGTLLAIGRFSEISGSVEVSTDGTSWTPANTTDTLSEGAIVRTTSGTGTIAFLADDSILRLDLNTVVQLQSGNLDGNTVAQAILSDGRLWGRVLTSTGVNIGGGGLIAGVRGTSISITKSGNNLTLTIVDSISPTAATITNKNSAGSTPSSIASGQVISFSSGSESIPPATTRDKATLLTDTWIKGNTIEDIVYLNVLSGSTDEGAIRASIEAEITEPKDTAEESALCGTGKKIRKGRKIKNEICIANNIVAIADFRLSEDDENEEIERLARNTKKSIDDIKNQIREDRKQIWDQSSGEAFDSNTDGLLRGTGGITDGSGSYMIDKTSNIKTIIVNIKKSPLYNGNGKQSILQFDTNHKIRASSGGIVLEIYNACLSRNQLGYCIEGWESTPIQDTITIEKKDTAWVISGKNISTDLGLNVSIIPYNRTSGMPSIIEISSIEFRN